MGWGLARLPGIEKGEDGCSGGGINTVQQLVVQGGAGLEALNRSFRFAFFVGTQQIGGVVAQEVGRNAGRALYMGGNGEFEGSQYLLFAFLHERTHVLCAQQPSGVVHHQIKAHAKGVIPAGGGDVTSFQKLLVIRGERLQNHVNTSASRQSSMPFSNLARKNCGRRFSGSE